MLRIDPHGKKRRIYVKRRDMLRSNGLLPRDLRRIDPSLSVTKTSPSISIKEHVLLVNLGGVRCRRCLPTVLLFPLTRQYTIPQSPIYERVQPQRLPFYCSHLSYSRASARIGQFWCQFWKP